MTAYSVSVYCLIANRHGRPIVVKSRKRVNALQLEAARRRAVPIRFNTSRVASLKSLSLSAAVLERIYCLYVTLRCDIEL